MLFGALWMIFFLLPVIIFNNTDIYLDHRAYLPLAGFIVMLIEMCLPFGRTLHLRSAPVALMLSSGIIIAYAVVSFAFCNKFADEKTFWESAAVTGRSSPQYAVIQDALGVVCVKGGKYEEALKCFERSIAVKPTAKAYYDKACTLAIVGDLPAAAKTYRIVLLQNPKSDESRRNLAAIEKYMNTHQWDRQRLKVSVAVK
jgi:tetratricopeptide (TPR) repeat protein